MLSKLLCFDFRPTSPCKNLNVGGHIRTIVANGSAITKLNVDFCYYSESIACAADVI